MPPKLPASPKEKEVPQPNMAHDKKLLRAADVVANIEKRFGNGSVWKGTEGSIDVDVVSSGSISLDLAAGVGGLPRGRIVEIYGPESSGKTTICLTAIAEAQRTGGLCAFVDVENALDPSWAKRIGVNLEELYISQPDSGEQALEIAQEFINSCIYDVVVIDSVAALVPRAEINGEMGDSHVGLQARLMSQSLRKLSGIIKQSNTLVIFTNQLRSKIGVTYGCFNRHSTVMLADGSKRKIGEIVNQKQQLEVMSWNEDTNVLEPKKILNWFKEGIAADDFKMSDNEIGKQRREYVTLVASYPYDRGFTKVTATSNHPIATPTGFQEAGDLQLGDMILAKHDRIVLSNDLDQLVLGSILGDASLKQVAKQTAAFIEEHAIGQSDYVAWKSKCFGDLSTGIKTSKRGTVGFSTKTLPVFADYKKEFYNHPDYPSRYKYIINETMLRKLTPLSLAIWFQDDGTMEGKGRLNGGYSIATHKLTIEEQEVIAKVFKEVFNLEPKLSSNGKTYGRISFNSEQAKRFEQLVNPYIHPSMAYKLHRTEHLSECLETLDMSYSTVVTTIPCPIYEIRDRYHEGKDAIRYNLEIEGNSTYVVGDVIVHNSPETTSGGNALKYFASMRIDVRRVETIKVGNEAVGNKTKATFKKNKVSAPFREAQFDIMFDEGISIVGEILDMAVEADFIEKRGAFYRYNDELIGQGRDKARLFLMQHGDMCFEIHNRVRELKGLQKLKNKPIYNKLAVAPLGDAEQDPEIDYSTGEIIREKTKKKRNNEPKPTGETIIASDGEELTVVEENDIDLSAMIEELDLEI